MITLGKRDTLQSRRQAASYIMTPQVTQKLFSEIAPKFADRAGGYTRIIAAGHRVGDNAKVAILELVTYELKKKEKKKKPKKKTPPNLDRPVSHRPVSVRPAPAPHRHSERSGPTFSSPFAPDGFAGRMGRPAQRGISLFSVPSPGFDFSPFGLPATHHAL